MKLPWTKKNETSLNELIEAKQSYMFGLDQDSAEYDKVLEQLERLYKLKGLYKLFGISPDVALTVAGNLAGILFILNYEKIGVVTTKAIGFVMKSRL